MVPFAGLIILKSSNTRYVSGRVPVQFGRSYLERWG